MSRNINDPDKPARNPRPKPWSPDAEPAYEPIEPGPHEPDREIEKKPYFHAGHGTLLAPGRAIAEIEEATKRKDIPQFRAGDTVRVHAKVTEGARSRVQIFQGIVIRLQGSGVRRTFTVRKISFGVGVERTFPLHSPVFDRIDVIARGDVRRAKLYYLRNLRGKAAKVKERREQDEI